MLGEAALMSMYQVDGAGLGLHVWRWSEAFLFRFFAPALRTTSSSIDQTQG